MSDDRNHDEFIDRAGRLLRQQTEELDADIRSRLTRARHRALESASRRRAPSPAWISAGATAAVAVLALGLWIGGQPGGSAEDPTQMAEDMDLLLSEESLELLEELEFYAWLDEGARDVG